MTEAKQKEPPSWAPLPLFMIGRDCRGNWVVKDQGGYAAVFLSTAKQLSDLCVRRTDIDSGPSSWSLELSNSI